MKKARTILGPQWAEAARSGIPFIIYALVLVVGIMTFLSRPKRSVSMHYEAAAMQWLQSESLYSHSMENGHGFLYLPHAAILHVPYAVVTQVTGLSLAGDVVWRIISWALLAFAVWRMGQRIAPENRMVQWRVAAIVGMLGISCLRIGQSTMLMTALMLLTVDIWQAKKYAFAAALIALAVAVKPLSIVMALLLFAISPPIRKPLLIACLVAIALPFCLQNPTYVWQQYRDCVVMLRVSANMGSSFSGADLFGLLEAFGITVGSGMQTATRVIAAFATLGVVWFSLRRIDPNRHAIWLFAWTAIYLMLFNPRSENSTYCMVAPVFAYFVAENVAVQKNFPVAYWLFALAVLTTGSYEIGRLILAPEISTTWLAPLCCCLLTVSLVTRLFRLESGATPVSWGQTSSV
ncbi:hypothetical protein CA13_43910 [Planctomycetes bacterium CA13]|uniref:DUF2029 domain-containing protein n=1 Tax=Novipirellula herctigrandis TaxID=2527986 RepID=A0A5C5Z6Q5_9BACT|nr:hypothetical protein CA13_43910 [Planctomycetes bacterium CA13]